MKRFILGILVLAVLIAIALYAVGFWTADVKEGSLPNVDISAEGGKLPELDVDTKKIIIGTSEENVQVSENITVPTVGLENQSQD